MLRIYNTLSRRIEPFEPVNPGKVKIYVCGPTVYDYSHVGHARTYVAFDVIKRYFRLTGYDVFHVQNITDIDDKIIDRAGREGRDWKEIVETYTKDYIESLEKLNIQVDLHPRVSDHIKEVIEFIQRLIELGYAYVAESGSVYFDVDMYEDYGKLSGRVAREQWGWEGLLKEKRHPYDFALWKSAKPGEPWWDSPWGPGRPGWHIECSVMSSRYLGRQFDIHGGGTDLIFPHHENERAQSEAALGVRPWVKYWLHTGMLNVKGEKMSKSLGNIISLRELFKRFPPNVIRLWLASAHYRRILDFSEDALQQAAANYERLVNAVHSLRSILKEGEPTSRIEDSELKILERIGSIRSSFYQSMESDFNMSEAFSYVYELTNIVFKRMEPTRSWTLALRTLEVMEEFNRVLGVLDEHLTGMPEAIPISEDLIQTVVDIRHKLREEKRYELADWIRDRLAELGIRLYDAKEGTKWMLIR